MCTDPAVEGVSVVAELLGFRVCHHVLVTEPCSPDGIPTALRLVFVSQHQCSCLAPDTITRNHKITSNPRPILQHNTRFLFILPVLLYPLPQIDLHTDLLRVIKHNLVQLAAVSVEVWRLLVAWRRLLVYDYLAGVPFVDVETVFGKVDGDAAHVACDASVAPAREDATGVGAEGYDVAEDLERGEGFVDDGGVAVADAFYGCCEAAETWSWLLEVVLSR